MKKKEDDWAYWPQKFVLCDCGSEGLFMLRNSWKEEGFAADEVYFNFAKFGRYDDRPRLKERIRWAWEILTNKNHIPDHLIIGKKQAQDIVDFLNENLLNETENKRVGKDKSHGRDDKVRVHDPL